MAAPIRFESVRKKDAERDALRKARSVVLEQVIVVDNNYLIKE